MVAAAMIPASYAMGEGPAQTNDGNTWVTGKCFLYCRRDEVRVVWIGPVMTPKGTGEFYWCGECIAELDQLVALHLRAKDLSDLTAR